MLKYILLVCVCLSLGYAQENYNWPKWRGPNADSISLETAWNPKAITKSKVVWQKEVGNGYASVAIQDGYLYTLGNQRKQDTIWCLDAATGKEIWKYSYACIPNQYPGSRASPVVENGLLYSLSNEGHLFCLETRTGKVKWHHQVQEEYEAEMPEWGFASSPYISGQRLFLNIGEHGIAFDKTTGELLWKSNPKVPPGYATVVTFQKKGEEIAAVFGSKAMYLVNAATGKKLWSYPWVTSYGVNAADPIIHQGRMFISSGYGYGCASFDITGDTPKLLWKTETMRNHFGTCILIDGYLYGIDGQCWGSGASLKCMNFTTGDEKWSVDVGFGSVIASNGYLIVLTDRGTVRIFEVNPKIYREVASGKGLDVGRGGQCWNIPVLCNGRLYCRSSNGRLSCVDLR